MRMGTTLILGTRRLLSSSEHLQAVLKGPPLPLDCSCGFMDSGEGAAQGFGEPCVHQVANPSRGPRGASAGRTHKAKDSQSPPPGMASHELTA